MGEVKREGVRRFEMSVHPEPEVPYSVRPIPDEHGAFTYWGTWMDDHAKEIADLRALAREAVKEAYAEAYSNAWNLTRKIYAEEDLLQESWLGSEAACAFKEVEEGCKLERKRII